MSQQSDSTRRCIFCEQDSNAVPLVMFEFKGKQQAICSQHLPMLIHKPAALASKLEGAADIAPTDHQH